MSKDYLGNWDYNREVNLLSISHPVGNPNSPIGESSQLPYIINIHNMSDLRLIKNIFDYHM
jgi:hypothetical protein